MNLPTHLWTRQGSVLAAIGVLLIVVGFAVARQSLSSPDEAGIEQTPHAESATGLATPRPGETPDFRLEVWYQKWVNEHAARTRADIIVSGISVGPTVQRTGSPCTESARPIEVGFDEAQRSRVAIDFGYVPDGGTIAPQGAVSCGG